MQFKRIKPRTALAALCLTSLAAYSAQAFNANINSAQRALLNGSGLSNKPTAIAPIDANDPSIVRPDPGLNDGTTAVKGPGTPVAPPAPLDPVTPVAPVAPLDPVEPVSPPSPQLPAPVPVGGAVTDVRLQNTSDKAQTAVPVTFGQVFAQGDLGKSDSLIGRLDDNSVVPLQVDVKARHSDGSVRHAVISTVLPSLAARATRTLALIKSGTAAASAPVLAPSSVIDPAFSASVSATLDGVKYSASADELLKAGAKATWLAGAVANEWHVSAPLKTSAGVAHPHLTARFAVRWYNDVKKARVDVTVENNWAYEPGPRNFTYNTEVVVGGKSVYKKNALTHLTQARWRKVYWYGETPQVNPMLNTRYLIASRALPNYDQSVKIAPEVLTTLATNFSGPGVEPMSVGLASPYMPMTGGREDIGLLPAWAVSYVLTMDQRARTATLGTADLAGSFSVHYRDRVTDQPISLKNYPYMTVMGRSTDTYNPVAKRYEAFPGCGGDCSTPNTHDISHQPGFAYLPYLVTGDYYYLEELQFWAMYNLLAQNPGYREAGKGLIVPEQERGQAWSMRSLAEAAYITPDADALKSDFTTLLDNNLNWFNATYTNNPAANKLGILVNGYAVGYDNVGVGPWQDDFFTAAIGHAADLGFDKARSLVVWKSKFPVGRMTAPGYCWIDGAAYVLRVRATETSPFYTTFAEMYNANHAPAFNALACNSPAMAASLGLKVGEMTGISSGNMGYPSNMQPALAYAVDFGAPGAQSAWALFMSRSVKPDYSTAAEFAIIPR